MGFKNLREFISELEQRGELFRVRAPVSNSLEMTEIQTRLLSEKGPAVLFENIINADGQQAQMPMLSNLFGTVNRVALGLNKEVSELRELGEQLAFLRQPAPPGGWREALDMLPLLKTVMSMKPKLTHRAPCQEVVLTEEAVDLSVLPVQQCWPDEPAPLISWPLIVTQGREGNTNLGIYRMQILGKDKTLMRWLAHRGGAGHAAEAASTGAAHFPAAAVIGVDPGTMIAAVTPAPENISEYQLAGFFRGKSVSLTECKTVPLKVPAEAEIIIEGQISLTETAPEGPYGDHTGYYNAVEEFPIFKVSAITMRRDPIYMTTFSGRPPDEPSVLGEALNEVFIPILIQQFPEIVDFWLPPEACSYRVAVVSIRKTYPGHAKRVMMGIWSYLKQFMYTKFIIVIDDDIDARNWTDVMWAISTNVEPIRDVTMINNTPIDYLDFSSPAEGLGSKMGIDATTKWPPEVKRQWGRRIQMSEKIVKMVTERWADYGLPGSGEPIWNWTNRQKK